jgi:hypothetical protein
VQRGVREERIGGDLGEECKRARGRDGVESGGDELEVRERRGGG